MLFIDCVNAVLKEWICTRRQLVLYLSGFYFALALLPVYHLNLSVGHVSSIWHTNHQLPHLVNSGGFLACSKEYISPHVIMGSQRVHKAQVSHGKECKESRSVVLESMAGKIGGLQWNVGVEERVVYKYKQEKGSIDYPKFGNVSVKKKLDMKEKNDIFTIPLLWALQNFNSQPQITYKYNLNYIFLFCFFFYLEPTSIVQRLMFFCCNQFL